MISGNKNCMVAKKKTAMNKVIHNTDKIMHIIRHWVLNMDIPLKRNKKDFALVMQVFLWMNEITIFPKLILVWLQYFEKKVSKTAGWRWIWNAKQILWRIIKKTKKNVGFSIFLAWKLPSIYKIKTKHINEFNINQR